MPNQKISELTAIVTVDTSLDVLPIVDTSANTTKKISPTALKTALALDNVNNTSDANKPVSTAQQDALNAKVTGNTAIVAATKTKITYDAKGLVTAGNVLDAADMPTAIDAAKIGAGAVSSTEFGYLDGVTSAIQTQLDAKQATLVSATNIKTINSTSLLGSGDISISAPPSGVAGAIQFSNGSAFASDAANFFWDDTNKRLGIGTNAPTQVLDLVRSSGLGAIRFFNIANSVNTIQSGATFRIFNNTAGTPAASVGFFQNLSNQIGINTNTPTASLNVQGSGSTSATTSLLVQNSAGTAALTVKDDLTSTFGGTTTIGGDINFVGNLIRTSRGRINFYGTDGEITLTNSTESSFGLLKFGGLTSSFPALKRSSTTLQARLADDSGYAPIDASLYKVGGTNGFTGTGSYTNFTIVGGIITNAS
jgi:hypothetical protein